MKVDISSEHAEPNERRGVVVHDEEESGHHPLSNRQFTEFLSKDTKLRGFKMNDVEN